MINGKFPAFHYELLNDIHASRAFRRVVGHHHFTKPELDEISHKVGDYSECRGDTFTPEWAQEAQPMLVANTLAAMARAFPYWDEE